MKVELISYTTDPVSSIESAASNCYDSIPTDGAIMNHCYESGHHSVLEFAQFQFKISGVSRATTHQLVRHRTAKFAQRSQRYVSEDSFKYVTPPSIAKNEDAKILYDGFMGSVQTVYNALKDYYGIPAEDARYVLTNACESVIEVSFDLRNLIHFCNERLCSRAQWEIREVAKKMVELVSEVEPKLKPFLVPKCEIHKDYPFCTEAKSCKRHPKLKDVYHKPSANPNFIILMGASGSGKTAISDRLREKYGLKPLISYTTRPPRYEGEDNHIFVSDEEFAKLEDFVAFTNYNGHRYCGTAKQVEESDLYTLDPNGVRYFKENYQGSKKPIVIFLDVDRETRAQRMKARNDNTEAVGDRLTNDDLEFLLASQLADVTLSNHDGQLEQVVDTIYTLWRG